MESCIAMLASVSRSVLAGDSPVGSVLPGEGCVDLCQRALCAWASGTIS